MMPSGKTCPSNGHWMIKTLIKIPALNAAFFLTVVSSPPRRSCRTSRLEHGHDCRDLLPDNRPQTVAGLLNSRAIFRPDRLDLANLLIRQSEFLEVRDPEGEAVADLFPPIFLYRLDLLLLLGVEDIPHLGQLFLHERPHFLADGFNLGLLVVGELRETR